MTNLTETASLLGTKVSEAQARAEDLSRAAGKKLDEAAGALHTAASSVRSTARQGCEAIDGFATNAADKLDATASYVEDHDLKGVLIGCRRLIRRYPTISDVRHRDRLLYRFCGPAHHTLMRKEIRKLTFTTLGCRS